MERKCKNCRLFDKSESVCTVRVLVQGEQYELPVRADDECHWERIEKEVNEDIRKEFGKYNNFYFKARMEEELRTPIEIKQIRSFSDGKNGFIEETI
jgi:hypothetical protein